MLVSPQATPKLRTKDQVRRSVWKAMEREGVSRFPGADGRIPNFAGAKLAAERLASNRLWKRARVIKANPDSPQTPCRRLALEQGKIVVMAVPRLKDVHPLRVLDPRKLSKQAIREAATIKGALRHGQVAGPEEIPDIDFVLCGSVAVNLNGARVGKGGGFSDLREQPARGAGVSERPGRAAGREERRRRRERRRPARWELREREPQHARAGGPEEG